MRQREEENSVLLGMPAGRAQYKLSRMVLFRQLQKHSENICSRCGQEIQSVNDLSIEHLKPWEGRSGKLFWDLDNVAFSHKACNRPHVHGSVSRRKVGPPGTSWCSRHQRFEVKEDFWPSRNRWNRLQTSCKNLAVS